ncbi:unnamed protein product [Meganyctiphanes norvegica]|uniref:Ras GTPase-activating protein n=1 Tax=Meganyctiphanes norvegica TaxID=48144 RepID=A0AAV2PU03_MEGNR
MQIRNWLSFVGPTNSVTPSNDALYGFTEPPSFTLSTEKDTSYEKACGERRGSAPTTPILGPVRPHDSTPNRLVNFFAKRSFKSIPMKRTKSVTKVERSRHHQQLNSLGHSGDRDVEENLAHTADPLRGSAYQDDEDTDDPLSPDVSQRLRSARSHESLLSSQVMDNLNVTAGEVNINPLHSSILGQEHCFQVTSPTGTRYFSCRTADERDRWVDSLRKAVNPNYEQTRRTENMLKIFILEAKGVSTKKRYYCELLLDGSLYARTSSKDKKDMCFWGEQFEFESLPSVETISVVLYRDMDKKKKKENNISLGTVTIPVSDLLNQSHVEKWYQVQTENNKNLSKDPLALRIKCKFQSLDILPLDMYTELLQYIKSHYSALCQILEPAVNVKAKEDIATCLVHIMQYEGHAQRFLADLVTLEFQRIDDAHLLFRGNSLATKAMEAFMKLVGEKYLMNTLGKVIKRIIEGDLDCEVDPMKIPHITTLQKRQESLLSVVGMTWSRILNSHPFFPLELRECFKLYREHLTACGKSDLSDNLISASIFLRFLCPAILSPSMFNIIQEYPDETASRNLTLIAKTLQTLANFTQFQGKENFMEFMNEFIETEQPNMKTFLSQISSPTVNNDQRSMEFDGDIDLGKQLSILHSLLSETMSKINKCKSDSTQHQEIEHLQNILEDISIAKSQTNNHTLKRTSKSQITTSIKESLPTSQDALKTDKRTGYQSLQRNSFKCDTKFNHSLEETTSPNIPESVDSPSAPRSSTLPRNAYLLGSGRKPALDLNTADDYVVFSALEGEKPRGRSPIGHGNSQCHLSHSHNQTISSPIYANQSHQHRNINNNMPHFSITKQSARAQQQAVRNNNAEESLDMSIDDIDGNSLADTEANFKGSQTSLSQLSNVASSGYQSFVYSQSSSPVDPTIIHHDHVNNNNTTLNNNRNCIHTASQLESIPLAFNNPMYNLESPNKPVSSIGPRDCSSHPSCYHQKLNQKSSSHSIDDLTFTPSFLHKSNKFPLHSAPRTNPRFLPPLRNIQHISPMSQGRHHSASDLLEPHRQRGKTRRLSTEPGRCHTRYQYESDSSSDNEHILQSSKNRRHRSQYRISDIKTLDQCEQEILALRSAMDDMHQKLTYAEGSLQSDQYLRKPPSHPSFHPHHHQPKYINTQSHIHKRNVNKERECRGSRNCSSVSCEHSNHNCNSRSHSVPSPHQKPTQNRHKVEKHSPANKEMSIEQEIQNEHMQDLLTKLLEIQNEFKEEKQKMCAMMNEKNAVILAQEDRMNGLEKTNNQLLMALDQIRQLNPRQEQTSKGKSA